MSSLFDIPFEEDDEPATARTPQREVTPPPRRIFTVSEITAQLRHTLETTFFEIWVEGEISNCRLWNTGHLYFTLKDSGAQLKAVMFRTAVQTMPFTAADGMRVIARGSIGIYPPKGEYQIVCERLEPFGVGARQLAFEQLKAKLEREGLCDAARKRPLPTLPRTIGVATSIDGAALRDIIKVLRRRYPNIHVIVRPTAVQGDGAAQHIARAIRALASLPQVDVIIVGRGGGSAEDLWAFNDERVARAIVASPVPVISAVGHETDVTIADFVADHRAATPSAAAEMVVARKDEFVQRIDRLALRLDGVIRGRLRQLSSRIDRITGRSALAGWPGRLAMRARHVSELEHELQQCMHDTLASSRRRLRLSQTTLEAHDVRRRFARIRPRLSSDEGRLRSAMLERRRRLDARLGRAAGRLDAMSPLAVLGRGYAVCWNEDRTAIIRDAAATDVGASVHVHLAHGELDCTVTGKVIVTMEKKLEGRREKGEGKVEGGS